MAKKYEKTGKKCSVTIGSPRRGVEDVAPYGEIAYLP